MWKPIYGYEGTYLVNYIGQIKNERLNKILSPFDNGRGYQSIYLYSGKNKRKVYKVHRLVANAFLSKQEGRDFVDHVNRNRSDNRVENLRWTTRIENNDNRIATKGSTCRHCGMKQ